MTQVQTAVATPPSLARRGAPPRDRSWVNHESIPEEARTGDGLPKKVFVVGSKKRKRIVADRSLCYCDPPTTWKEALKYDKLLEKTQLLDYTVTWEQQKHDALIKSVIFLFVKHKLNVKQSVWTLQRKSLHYLLVTNHLTTLRIELNLPCQWWL